jgi:hypothetical protein
MSIEEWAFICQRQVGYFIYAILARTKSVSASIVATLSVRYIVSILYDGESSWCQQCVLTQSTTSTVTPTFGILWFPYPFTIRHLRCFSPRLLLAYQLRIRLVAAF